jgi:hypothetical protein
MVLPGLRIERPPFAADPFRFVVAGTDSCLNVREQPASTANVIACVADGTAGTLAPGSLAGIEEPTAATFEQSATTIERWARVHFATGEEGWVSASFLAWAK